MKASVLAETLAVLVILGFSMQSAWADEGYGHAGQQGMGPGMGGHREGTGHYLRHLMRHQKGIGLKAEHEKMMREHRKGEMGRGTMRGGGPGGSSKMESKTGEERTERTQ